MPKTGIPTTDYLLVVISFLPLLPVLLIFGRKLYLQEPLNFLLIVCLLAFFKGLLGLAYPLTKEDQSIANKLFSLFQLLLLVQCFRTNLNARYRYGMDILLSGLLCAAVTYWSVKGWDNAYPAIDILLSIFLGGVVLISLPTVIQSGALQVFRSPLFWIGAGTLSYLLLYLMMEGIGACYRPATSPPDPDKHLFLLLADLLRYFLYLVAAISTRQQQMEQRESV